MVSGLGGQAADGHGDLPLENGGQEGLQGPGTRLGGLAPSQPFTSLILSKSSGPPKTFKLDPLTSSPHFCCGLPKK